MSRYHRWWFVIVCSLLWLAWAGSVLADSFILRASVPAQPGDFQLAVESSWTTPIPANTSVVYTITYGWLRPTPTDIMVIQITWSQGQLSGQPIDMVNYVTGSATSAGQFAPQVDIANRTITWNISPVAPGADRKVYFTLRTSSLVNTQPILFTVNSRIIGPGITLPWQTLNQYYLHSATVPTLTPTPPPSITPSGGKHRPSLPLIIQRTIDQLNHLAQQGGGGIAAPLLTLALLPWLVSILTTIMTFLPSLNWWQLLSILGLLFWRKPRHPWGVVYDATTKLPLDPVLLILTDECGRTFQTVTDMYGRYQFIVEPGQYALQAFKSNYHFPATSLHFQPHDDIYSNLYYGQTITVPRNSVVSFNIPMDPTASDWNERQKQQLGLGPSPYWQKMSHYVFGLGFAWSGVMAILYFSVVNASIAMIYLAILAAWWWHHAHHPVGVVTDARGKPVVGAVVKLVDVAYPQLNRAPVVTGTGGRYAFLVDRGLYRLQVAFKRTGGLEVVTTTEPIKQGQPEGYVAEHITVSSHH